MLCSVTFSVSSFLFFSWFVRTLMVISKFLIGYLLKLDASKDNLLFVRTWYWLFDFLIFASTSNGSDWLKVCDVTKLFHLRILENNCIGLEKRFLVSLFLVDFSISCSNWSSEYSVVRNFDLFNK